VLRTLPEIVMSASDKRRMLVCQRLKTVADVMELLGFRQYGFKVHGRPRFAFRPRDCLSVSRLERDR
jgi:hypothetical protein